MSAAKPAKISWRARLTKEDSKMPHRNFSVAVILVFALGSVVLADPPTLSIEPQATLITGAVIVRVNVNCGDGASIGDLLVGVRQGDMAMEVLTEFNSTGNRQQVSVTVPGVFAAGDAVASALLQCALLLEGQQLGSTIRISP
jgi:hypothetical protein